MYQNAGSLHSIASLGETRLRGPNAKNPTAENGSDTRAPTPDRVVPAGRFVNSPPEHPRASRFAGQRSTAVSPNKHRRKPPSWTHRRTVRSQFATSASQPTVTSRPRAIPWGKTCDRNVAQFKPTQNPQWGQHIMAKPSVRVQALACARRLNAVIQWTMPGWVDEWSSTTTRCEPAQIQRLLRVGAGRVKTNNHPLQRWGEAA